MIDVKKIGKNYGSFQALQDVSFSIGTGEVVGLLGPNGAGKTTLMRILTGYHYPSAGEARVDGINVMEDPLAVRRRIGYLPENAPVYEEMLVSEYLSFIAEARGIPPGEAPGKIARAVEECGLAQHYHRSIGVLSKGYRQRVGLAQAIIHDPPLLILDEPTTGLDPHQILEIRQLIRRLGEKKTVVLSTHILQEVEAVCGPVLILNQGRIAAQGTAEEIRSTLSGEARFHLRIDGLSESPADLEKSLLALDGLSAVPLWEETSGGYRLTVTGRAGDETAGALFDWTVEKGGRLLEMRPEKLSLEEIFIRLTEDSHETS